MNITKLLKRLYVFALPVVMIETRTVDQLTGGSAQFVKAVGIRNVDNGWKKEAEMPEERQKKNNNNK